MPISLGSNIASLTAQRRLADGTNSLSLSFERLSSGLRINRASDDAAGLAIASSLRADTRVFTQAIRNVNDGFSVLSIAQGALTELSGISIRQRELAEQAANGSYSLIQRRSLNAEANALVNEFNRIVGSVDFNGRKLLDKSLDGLRIQAGYGTDGSVAFGLADELARTVGDGSFNAGTSYTLPNTGPRAVAVGDLNGDGFLDTVTTGFYSGITTIRFGAGDGSFGSAINYAGGASDVAIGDLNGDGLLDLAFTGGRIRLNTGNGTFGALQDYPGETISSICVALADLNGDGILDLMTGGQSASGAEVNVRLGNGNGSFRAAVSYQTSGTNYVEHVTSGDVNGDGIIDLVYGHSYGGGVSIRLGKGDGTFGSASSYYMGGFRTYDTALGDLNGDGILDLVSATRPGFMGVRLGNGDGGFGALATYAMNTSDAYSLELGDLNGDGILDAVTAGRDNASTTLGVTLFRLGNGDGTFGAAISMVTHGAATADVKLGDFNNDGALDIVSVGTNDINGYMVVSFANTRETTSISRLNITTREGALEAMSVIDATLRRISSELGAIGSTQSRLSVALENLAVSRENFEAAAGRIQDADVAAESADLTRTGILQQAAAAVLAQANQQPALALKLLV